MRQPLFAALLACAAVPALAQEQPDPAPTDAEQIIVTGTRAANRTVADSAVPIDVIPADALTNQGFTETNRVLSQLVPSFNFPQPSITDGTDVIRPATLRGLNPDQTLVLINGKRRHTTSLLNINGSVGRGTSAVDINLIPTIALSRVEVLRDGAAAQYGSDAIAGVINFQLNDAREGGRLTVTYGRYDTDIRGVDRVTGVVTGPNGQPLLAPDGTFQLATDGDSKRETDGDTLTVAGNIGLPLGSEGFLNVSAEYRDRDATNRSGYDPRRQYALIGGLVDPRELTFDRRNHRYGDAATGDINVIVNAGIPVGAAELYFVGTFGDREGQSAGFYRIASDARNVPAIYPDGFLPLITTQLRDYAGTLGVKGEAMGWAWDLSAGFGRNTFDFTIKNSLNRSLGPTSPTEFDSGGLDYSQWIINADARRTIAVDFLSSLDVAFGGEFRGERFDIRPGEVNSYANGTFGGAPGAQVFPGFAPVLGGQRVDEPNHRDNVSAYAEVDANITERLNVQLAGRYEDYSDFGTDWNGKAAGRFEFIEGYAVRGAISTGFRAPSLQQQFYGAQATNNVNGILLETLTVPVDNPVALALGAQPLKAETSISYSAGLTLNPVRALSVTADVYQIEIDDRIVVTENLGSTGTPAANAAVRALLTAHGFPFVTAARFFINGVDTRTRGLDVVATYRFDLGDINIRATAGYNLNDTKITGAQTELGPLAQIPGLVLFGRQESLRLTRGQPEDKINLGLDLDWKWLGGTARANRYGEVLAGGSDAFLDYPIDPEWVVDVELRARPIEAIEFAIGANNVLDAYPNALPVGAGVDPVTGAARNYPATNYFQNFSNYAPFGFNGRFLYARASLRF